MRLLFYFHAILAWCTLSWAEEGGAPKKRQIYREQVLPHIGGKIPDAAFQTDRLLLNRLQSEGISIPDGVVPEVRNPYVYQYHNKSPRTVYRIALSSDGRFTPSVGKYHYRENPTVETTYLYPLTHIQHGRFAMSTLSSAPSSVPATTFPHTKSNDKLPPVVYPVYRQLQLYSPHLNQAKFQTPKKTKFPSTHLPNANDIQATPYKSSSYQNFLIYNAGDLNQAAILDVPTVKGINVKSNLNKHSTPLKYNANQVFDEFNEYFDKFDLYEDGSNLQYRIKSH